MSDYTRCNQIMKNRWRKRGRDQTKQKARTQDRETERDMIQCDVDVGMTHQSERGLECGARPATPIHHGGIDVHDDRRSQSKKSHQDNP